jgi:hypothetical protein
MLSLFLHFDKQGSTLGRGVRSATAVIRSEGIKTPPATDASALVSGNISQAGLENSLPQKKGLHVPAVETINRTESRRDHQALSDRAPQGALPADIRTGLSWESEKSVLQRFMNFKGERSLRSFAALFERSDRASTLQQPAIAFSDGETPVVITLELQKEEQGSPEIAVWDATLVSLQRNVRNNWAATVIPSEGAWDANLIFKRGKEVIEFPLVVAPRIPIENNINDENALDALNRFCMDQAAAGNWGNVPYLNEYIFMANYLAHRGRSLQDGMQK